MCVFLVSVTVVLMGPRAVTRNSILSSRGANAMAFCFGKVGCGQCAERWLVAGGNVRMGNARSDSLLLVAM